jgi:putative lipoic acid-binding regulatory protein
MFKFIVPHNQTQKVLDLFESRDELRTRPSRHGRYMSVTAKCTVSSSDEIVAVYQAAAQIEGVISL